MKKIVESFLRLCSKKRGEIKASLISSKELSKVELENISEEKLDSYQERFIREQDSFFVEIPECDYKDVGCWEEFQGFFNIFQQTVLLCNENELDRDTCISYSKRIQEEFKLKMNEINNN